MIEMKIGSKDWFFDRKAVTNQIDEKESKVFNRIGGRIRTHAMRGMRSQRKPKRKKIPPTPSPPGQPPKRRVPMGSGLSKIWYSYDRPNHRVVVGPLKFNWSEYPEMTVPQLHEFGGSVTITELDMSVTREGWQAPGGERWVRVGKRGRMNKFNRPMRSTTANYPARPFMFPALEANRQFIADAWSGARVGVGAG